MTDPTAGAAAALAAPQVSVRLRAAMALGTWPDVGHLEAVVQRSAVEPDPFVRDTLAWVLTRLPSAPVLARLRPELDDPRPQARAQALHALSKVLDRSARPWITPQLLADPDDVVARTAWRSALALTPREDLEDGQDVDPAAAAEREELAELLASQLGRGDEELQRSLSRVLVQLGPAADAVLERAAGSARPEVAEHAEAARRLLRDPEAPFRPGSAEPFEPAEPAGGSDG
jgi:HEAT repeat protein